MKAKHARQIRAGILEGRKLFPNYAILTKLGRRAFAHETERFLKALLAGKVYIFRT